MTPLRSSSFLVVLVSVAASCSSGRGRGPADDSSVADATTDAGVDAADGGEEDTASPPPFALASEVFVEGGMIPLRYECGPPLIADGPGENVTPPLSWTEGPAETQSYALVVRDVDAGDLVHWVVYDIAATTRSLPEDVPDGFMPAALSGAKQAELQGSGYFGYLGPCSDGRVNTYRFTIHAMGEAVLSGVDEMTAEDDVAAMVESSSIASASLSGES